MNDTRIRISCAAPILLTLMCHAAGAAPRAVIPDYDADVARIADTGTDTIIGSIAVADEPRFALVHPGSDIAHVVSSRAITSIEATSMPVVNQFTLEGIDLGGYEVSAAVLSAGGTTVYLGVFQYAGGEFSGVRVVEIDLQTGALVGEGPPLSEYPIGDMAVAPNHPWRLFVIDNTYDVGMVGAKRKRGQSSFPSNEAANRCYRTTRTRPACCNQRNCRNDRLGARKVL